MRNGRCKHFNGLQNGKCKKGISYDSFGPRKPMRVELPCLRTAPALYGREPRPQWDGVKACEIYEEQTKGEREQFEREVSEAVAKMFMVRKAIVEHTGGKRGVDGTIDCPACGTGKVRFAVAGINGHIWAKCSTQGCAEWVE